MNKRFVPYSTLSMAGLVSVVACVYLLTGSPTLKYVGPVEFKRQFEMRNKQTVYWSEYIGQADGKAYILRKRIPLFGKKLREEILFTETGPLGEDFMNILEKEIQNRRTPPHDVE